jgi:Calx-beta domain-containing protein
VKLNKKSDGSVTINYTTLDGTATAADHDYQPTSGTLTFAAGEKTKTITVTIYGDTKVEHNEDFFVKITSGSSSVKIDGDGKNRVEISNDDRDLSRQV